MRQQELLGKWAEIEPRFVGYAITDRGSLLIDREFVHLRQALASLAAPVDSLRVTFARLAGLPAVASERSERLAKAGGEGGNRTHPPARSAGATILKTVTTTRHVSLSALDRIVVGRTKDRRCRGGSMSPVEQRADLVREYESGLFTMTELAAQYGISRKTGYKWVAAYTATGLPGLQDRSRRPRHSPHATDEAIVALSWPFGAAIRTGGRRSCWPSHNVAIRM